MSGEEFAEKDFLLHMLEAADRILSYTKGKSREDFVSETILQDWEEDDVRLLASFVTSVSDDKQIKFRDSPLGRAPYLEVPLDLSGKDSPLRKVVVGPSPARDEAIASLSIYLEQKRIRDVEVVPSQIPYRNW